ncbi:hypothetical protein ABW19_dt0206425 [Dactylella cylindrospora]|nr:hypothetical protein ABW19_dt0206425 [Dactylella cylindrospora]
MDRNSQEPLSGRVPTPSGEGKQLPGEEPETSGSAWNPRHFGWKQWLGVAFAAAIVAVAIAVPITIVEMNKYPDYTTITYSLTDTYEGQSFFDEFDYGNGTEATNGFTNYVTREGAVWSNLTYTTNGQATLRVLDSGNTGTAGRPTVKILSKKTYTHGLFIFDIAHSPFGCGTWPAIWTSDPDVWPTNGEIDVIEAVNQGNKGSQFTLHTTNGCTMNVKRKQTGSTLSANCLNSTNNNEGCAVRGPVSSYGEELNDNGGGVFAMEWRTAGIRIWFFARASVPSDITNEAPDPSTWGTATADFPSTKCDINSHFQNHKIIINISLCGDWAGATSVYTDEYNCPGNCTSYVANNPSAFQTAYWSINSIKVYSSPNS